MSKCAKDTEGIIHAISACNGEYTLCGNAFDGDCFSGGDEKYSWKSIDKGIVNCKNCIMIIEGLKGVKYEKN